MKDCKVSLHSFTLKGECEIVPLTDPETGQSKPAILQTICVPETRQTIQNMLDISEEEAATNIFVITDPDSGRQYIQFTQTVTDPCSGHTVQIPINQSPLETLDEGCYFISFLFSLLLISKSDL